MQTMYMEERGFPESASKARAAIRAALITSAVAAIVLGVIALFWPGPTLVAVAVLFGLWLVIGGVMRIATAITSHFLSAGMRWTLGILGVLVVIAGIVCLFHPGQALWVLTVFIGISWILDGVMALFSGRDRATVGPRWLYIAGAVISVVAGIIVLAMPAVAVATFAMFGGILLIVIGIVTLFTLPPSEALKRA
ncbi:HdeD family acid-resistance protein [Tomitella fengzijianii]|uniref:DUF308 domain-containing protein n=1 Tax=Tomitella fengzijianii TaxID=2597660 RepID=A0A516WZN1_9ACTN|nr:DUF308 domain-containing protein [Tomitella fengzijianii]QDQ96282.1 DUF308 domain-containing protein [Tomitella fengzijianii]